MRNPDLGAERGVVVVRRLVEAVVAHDLDAVGDCFEPDYRNETPAHPNRGFTGRDQVKANWARMFEAVPDITARVLRTAVNEEAVWSEWEMSGTRTDGQRLLMSGVIIFGVSQERVSWARFYLEPVDSEVGGIDAAVSQILTSKPNLP